jgi:hypothetical protein
MACSVKCLDGRMPDGAINCCLMVDLRDRHWKRIVRQWTALRKLSIQTSLTSYAEQPATGRIGIDGAALEC